MIVIGQDIGYTTCAWCDNEATEIAMLQYICSDCLQDYQDDFERYGH